MIISFPNDGRGLIYHIVDLHGQTVHAYRDFDAAWCAREDDQRLCIYDEGWKRWLTDPPAPDRDIAETEKLLRWLGNSYYGVYKIDGGQLDPAAKFAVADTQDDEEGFYLEGPDLLQLCRDAVSHLEIA